MKNLENGKIVRIFTKKFNMAKYKRQMNTAMERLDQGLARVHSLIKRGKNADAIHYMDNNLKELYGELQNIINVEPDSENPRVRGL